MKDIPLHLLKERASSGLQIERFLECDSHKKDERKLLKGQGYPSAQIKVQGFWYSQMKVYKFGEPKKLY